MHVNDNIAVRLRYPGFTGREAEVKFFQATQQVLGFITPKSAFCSVQQVMLTNCGMHISKELLRDKRNQKEQKVQIK